MQSILIDQMQQQCATENNNTEIWENIVMRCGANNSCYQQLVNQLFQEKIEAICLAETLLGNIYNDPVAEANNLFGSEMISFIVNSCLCCIIGATSSFLFNPIINYFVNKFSKLKKSQGVEDQQNYEGTQKAGEELSEVNIEEGTLGKT